MELNSGVSSTVSGIKAGLFEKTKDVLNYIPIMEKEFSRVESIIGNELTPEAAYFYYDFYEMALELREILKDTDAFRQDVVQKELIERTVNVCQELEDDKLWSLLTGVVKVDHVDRGYLEKKIKDKTILKILRALKSSFR
ncbi:hypothetical protein [Echinicola strongylocentroti]|nr:hypothetical protein [Echinicola strongylocentroti]